MQQGNSKFLNIKIFKKPNRLSPSTFHFIISSKISKRATERNRLKRLLKEWARVNFKNINPGYKILVILRPEANQLIPLTLKSIFLKALKNTKFPVY